MIPNKSLGAVQERWRVLNKPKKAGNDLVSGHHDQVGSMDDIDIYTYVYIYIYRYMYIYIHVDADVQIFVCICR